MLNSEAVEQAAQGNRGSLEVFRGRLDGGFSNQILWKTSLPMGWWTTTSLGRCLPPKPMVKRHRRHTEIKEVTRVWISKGSGLDSSFVLGWPTSSFPVSKGSDLPLGVNPEVLPLAGLLLGSNSTSNNLILVWLNFHTTVGWFYAFVYLWRLNSFFFHKRCLCLAVGGREREGFCSWSWGKSWRPQQPRILWTQVHWWHHSLCLKYEKTPKTEQF